MPLKGLLAGTRSCGCVEGESEKDVRSADKTCFFKKKFDFWVDFDIFKSRKVQELRVEN